MGTQEKIRVKVEIYGRPYKLMAGPGTPAEYLHKVASLVDEQMHKISKHQPSLDIPRVAVLAAANLADQLCRAQAELNQASERQNGELLDENERLRKQVEELQLQNNELKAKVEKLQSEKPDPNDLVTKYAQLQEEYAKLQNEFNDWLHLVEKEQERH